MLPIAPTQRLKERHVYLKEVNFHSPDGVPEDEVGTLTALCGPIQGGILDGGPIIKTFWRPSEEEIAALVNGAVIEIDILDANLAPMAINVEVDV